MLGCRAFPWASSMSFNLGRSTKPIGRWISRGTCLERFSALMPEWSMVRPRRYRNSDVLNVALMILWQPRAVKMKMPTVTPEIHISAIEWDPHPHPASSAADFTIVQKGRPVGMISLNNNNVWGVGTRMGGATGQQSASGGPVDNSLWNPCQHTSAALALQKEPRSLPRTGGPT